jgi:glycine cleavage system regulatory protein
MWKNLAKIPIKHPLAFGVGVSTVKTSASDLLVQTVVEQRQLSDIDWKRNAAFATFGCFYLGGVQYAIYVPLFGRLFPNAANFAAKPIREKLKDIKGIGALCGQVFLDQFIHHPLLYFPVFYATREVVMAEKPDLIRCMLTYKDNMKEDLTALWKVWVPSTFVNFAFMPMWARIPWVAGTSLLWTCILSAMRGGDVMHSDEIEAPVPMGSTFTMIKESLDDVFASPVDLDDHLSHICVSGAGPDRIGHVARMARVVADNGGNVTHSKMIRLGQEFTTLMHVSIEPEKQQQLVKSLRSNKDLKLMNIRASALKRRTTGSYQSSVHAFKIHVVGGDRPGMLASIAELIASRNMSIEDVTTELRRGKNNRRDFVINAEVVTSETMDQEKLDSLVADFDKLKAELNLSVVDIRISHFVEDTD